ncbi:MAG: hypothetical protein FWE89_00155 [Syntrophaceae bacterium]|nr:hypothetical protein [Syntrophaceae bacterium]
MEERETLNQLEALAERLGITVRHEALKGEASAHAGVFCRIHGKDVLFLNKKARETEKRFLLQEALKRYDLSKIYILPSLRTLLDLPGDASTDSL